jgi:hypothetical protein
MATQNSGVFEKKNSTSESISARTDFNVVLISHAATIAGFM